MQIDFLQPFLIIFHFDHIKLCLRCIAKLQYFAAIEVIRVSLGQVWWYGLV